jgi:transaldolase
MFNYFIDTADTTYIKDLWTKIKSHSSKECMLGITTNPNAFFKTGDLTLNQWIEKSKILGDIISDIRQDNVGELHIQFPSSVVEEKTFIKFIDLLPEFTNNNVQVCIKIPPFEHALKIAQKHKKNYKLNVTGTSDAATALLALSYDIKYLSIIPGRMEEQSIDAKSHVSYLQNRNIKNNHIITGSMRTLECVKWCVEYDTIPTIGTRVWDQITDKNISEFFNYVNQPEIKNTNETKFGPHISIVNNDLSLAFFNEMDSKGLQCYENLLTR